MLNEYTDGVLYEVECNLEMICEHLQGKHDYTSGPDTNYNVKNQRHQHIGRSSTATIGHYVFDS